ncbi:hypothetical protein CO174_00715 [Candidatus Uhrbacteria bacterium CG_4_9_14_3_um_filter_50_9]|uniref:Major facilitator superfamily (MFS) profile domain-containing protein n=1 Tax=Candidatus Uhrbacteria bacterium CG_4_9_14_3_um_filter_50_9 TaxID=1975035 RepID=A0A2M7XE39_9BACT|nr:MAG: hypothetical protein CO174_00715 [Candidatus Uhrbacteria bacterium CG_4_9_14_3_um_filter_50_9]
MKFLDDIKKYYLFRAFNKRLAMPVWFLFMVDQGLSIQQIALIAGVSTALSFILEIPSGSVADTIGHKQALILSMLGQGAGLAFFIGGSFWWILAGSLAYWGIGTLMTGTHEAFFFEKVTELGRKNEYQKLMGRSRSVSSVFSAVAVSTAGVLYLINPVLPFLISACIYWLGAAVVLTFQPNQKDVSVAKMEGFEAWIHHFKVGWETITNSPPLFYLMLFNAILYGVTMASTEMQQIILNNIGLAVALFGPLYALKRLFSASLAPILHRFRSVFTTTKTLIIMLSSLLTYLILIAHVNHTGAIFLVVLFASFVIIISDIIISDLMNQLIPTGSRATTLSMGNFGGLIMKLLTLGFFGIATTLISIETAHLYLAVFVAILGITLLPRASAAFRDSL